MVWFSHLFQNFLQFILIHTVKGFGIVNKVEEIDVFLELSCFFDDPVDVGNLISVSGGLRGATPWSRSGGVAMRNYLSSKVRSSGCTLLEQP